MQYIFADMELMHKNFFVVQGQARLDGAFCEYSSSDKDRYMLRLKDAGVTNIEMESTAFTALTHKAGFKSAVVCVTLLDRLNEDQVLNFNVRSKNNRNLYKFHIDDFLIIQNFFPNRLLRQKRPCWHGKIVLKNLSLNTSSVVCQARLN